jgi:hypothetical protein
MDLERFADASVAGVPLVMVIMGLVYWFKSFTKKDGSKVFEGNGLLMVSMGIGLVLGGLFMLTQTRPPVGDWWTGLQYWFALAVYGLMMGLVASGLYEVARGFVEKTFGELFKGLVLKMVKTPRLEEPGQPSPLLRNGEGVSEDGR